MLFIGVYTQSAQRYERMSWHLLHYSTSRDKGRRDSAIFDERLLPFSLLLV
ncbi:hypothetical protein ARMA_0340 [Ardenticatena maritima]|uniref:Uncharacterized protein n=1 Tax=Ardenticatena maritima TaxID=872965 RepID=A0A0M9UBM0_9CHLR|nr:hypothetical protein ARMA_0340 [Ardenticatena maritima]